MGVVDIETVINEDKKFLFEIETEKLCTINCRCGIVIESPDAIYKICIVDPIFVIMTEDRAFRDGALLVDPAMIDERRENNIIAYDWKGNYLWNIGELVGDIKMPFRGVGYISHKEAEEKYEVKVKNPSNILFKCIAGGFAFIIDATEKKLLLKVGGMR